MNRTLRVDLTKGKIESETRDEATLRNCVGGASLGINVEGSGAIAVVTKGALTHGIASSQANGYFGAYLRSSGFDNIIMQGASPEEVYLYLHDGTAELREASHLKGKDTFEVEDLIKEDLHQGRKQISVLSIGPAGENLVRFALISAGKGHVAAHNGVGAVMGSKKLKAIAVERGKGSIPAKDKEALSRLAKEIRAAALADKFYYMISVEGLVGSVPRNSMAGRVVVKNYTTSIHAIDHDKLDKYTSESIRLNFKAKPSPC